MEQGNIFVCKGCGSSSYVTGTAYCSRCEPKVAVNIPPRIVIDVVPHASQRYDTCGDYQLKNGYFVNTECTVLHITVSDTKDRREMLLIAIHELIEWALCQAKGITNEEIDRFDLQFEAGAQGLAYEAGLGKVEPGDQLDAPYYHQHQIATGIERILAAEMGVDWLEYERHIEELKR